MTVGVQGSRDVVGFNPAGWNAIMTRENHLTLTREELYSLVWAKPMTEVSRDFQISDRALAKICARRQVPVPPRGYWAKKSAGKDVSQLPLPELAARPQPERR